jgi:hypothetical protein
MIRKSLFGIAVVVQLAGSMRIDRFGVQSEVSRLHITRMTDNHIEQNTSGFFFTDYSIRRAVSYLITMPTKKLHARIKSKAHAAPNEL